MQTWRTTDSSTRTRSRRSRMSTSRTSTTTPKVRSSSPPPSCESGGSKKRARPDYLLVVLLLRIRVFRWLCTHRVLIWVLTDAYRFVVLANLAAPLFLGEWGLRWGDCNIFTMSLVAGNRQIKLIEKDISVLSSFCICSCFLCIADGSFTTVTRRRCICAS